MTMIVIKMIVICDSIAHSTIRNSSNNFATMLIKSAHNTLSSTEPDYVSSTLDSQEAIWLRSLISIIGFNQSTATVLHEDNHGALELSRNTIHHALTEYVDIKYHFLRNAVGSKEVELMYCPTNVVIADVFTKGLAKQIFQAMREQLGVESLR